MHLYIYHLIQEFCRMGLGGGGGGGLKSCLYYANSADDTRYLCLSPASYRQYGTLVAQ